MTQATYNWIEAAISKVGFPIVVALMLLYVVHLRLKSMDEQIASLRADTVEQRVFIRETLSSQLERSNNIIDRNTELYGKLYRDLELKQ